MSLLFSGFLRRTFAAPRYQRNTVHSNVERDRTDSDLDGECENDVDLGQNWFNVFRHVNLGHARVAVVHRSSTHTHQPNTYNTSHTNVHNYTDSTLCLPEPNFNLFFNKRRYLSFISKALKQNFIP